MNWPDPFSKLTDELVENYPLTKEELRLIAAFWTAVHVRDSVWCYLFSTVGGAELQAAEYTAGRVNLAAGILGKEDMASVYRDGDKLVRGRIGDALWSAYQAGSPLGEELMAATLDSPLLARLGLKRQSWFKGNDPRLNIGVWWDWELNTYGVEVWDGERESGELQLRVGERRNQVTTVEAIEELLAPFGGMPEHLRDELVPEVDYECYSFHSKL